AAETGLPGVKRVAVEGVGALLEADGASVFVYDSARKKLVFDAVSGAASAALIECELDEGEGIAGRVAVTRVSVLREDARDCHLIDRSFDERSGFQTGSLVAAPLVVADELVGVLEAVRGATRPPFN